MADHLKKDVDSPVQTITVVPAHKAAEKDGGITVKLDSSKSIASNVADQMKKATMVKL